MLLMESVFKLFFPGILADKKGKYLVITNQLDLHL